MPTEQKACASISLPLAAYRPGPKYVAQLVETPPQFHDAPLRRRGMQAMVAYARIAGLVLLGIAVVGAAGWDWRFAPVSYHAGAGLFFLLVGFSRLGTATILQMVGGLGVLLALVNAVLLCEIHQVIENNCLGMTQFYVLTNQRLLFWSTC